MTEPPTAAPSTDPTRETLISGHRPYAHALATQLWKRFGSTVELDELKAAAELGLVEAADRYDFRGGVAFATFAHYRIRGAVFDCLHKMGRLDRTGRARRKFEEAAATVTAGQGPHDPAESDPSAAVRIVDGLRRLGAAFLISLDSAEDVPTVPDPNVEPPDRRMQDEEARQRLAAALGGLEEQEQAIVRMYYYEDLTMEEIGRRLSKGKPWISRLHARILAKLSRLLGEPG